MATTSPMNRRGSSADTASPSVIACMPASSEDCVKRRNRAARQSQPTEDRTELTWVNLVN